MEPPLGGPASGQGAVSPPSTPRPPPAPKALPRWQQRVQATPGAVYTIFVIFTASHGTGGGGGGDGRARRIGSDHRRRMAAPCFPRVPTSAPPALLRQCILLASCAVVALMAMVTIGSHTSSTSLHSTARALGTTAHKVHPPPLCRCPSAPRRSGRCAPVLTDALSCPQRTGRVCAVGGRRRPSDRRTGVDSWKPAARSQFGCFTNRSPPPLCACEPEGACTRPVRR